MMARGKMKYLGFLGFLGFLGCGYFDGGSVGELFWFSFFAFFAYFVLGNVLAEMPDERYRYNSARAKLKAAPIAFAALFLVGFSATLPLASLALMVALSALGWAATLLVYAGLLLYYEKY